MATGTFTALAPFIALLTANGMVAVASPAQGAKKLLADYKVLVVEKFKVDEKAAKRDYPGGYEGALKKAAVDGVRGASIFEDVIDAAQSQPTETGSSGETVAAKRRLVLQGMVISYNKGSQAGRGIIGLGVGAARVRVRFVFRDVQTGQKILTVECQGKYLGTTKMGGGSDELAVTEAARKIVDKLVQKIKENR